MTKERGLRVTVLGTRGSVPVSGHEFQEFGTGTSCLRVLAEGETGTEEIYLDAGSGIVSSRPQKEGRITVLITHFHLDHLIGLPFFVALSEKGREIDIYGAPRSGISLDEAMARLFSRPFWPLGVLDYPADVRLLPLPERFSVGEVAVDTLEMSHPDGATAFRLTFGGASLVYATDYELESPTPAALTDFAKGTDLLILDGQYTEEEYTRCRGYGHSTPENGLTLSKETGAKKTLFFHHAPDHSDELLRGWEERLREKDPSVSFARAGEEIWLAG